MLVTIQNCSFLLANGAPVPALMRFFLHRPLPLVCVGSFRLCGTAGSRGGSGARREGGGEIPWGGGGGGGAPPPLPQATPLVPANSHNCPPKLGLAPRPTGGSGSTWNHRAPSPSPPLRHTDDNDGDDVVHNDVDVLFPVWLLVVPFLLCCSGLRQRMFIA